MSKDIKKLFLKKDLPISAGEVLPAATGAVEFRNPITGSVIKGEAPTKDVVRAGRANAISLCCPLCDEWLHGQEEIKGHRCGEEGE